MLWIFEHGVLLSSPILFVDLHQKWLNEPKPILLLLLLLLLI